MAVRSPLALSAAKRGARVGKRVELEVAVEQSGAQRAIDRRIARERVVERALGQRPEIDVMSGGGQHPGIFELLRAPDFGEAISVGAGRIAIAGDRRVHVEQRSVGVEHEGADWHGFSPRRC